GLAPDATLDASTQAAMFGAWSTVHGFAHLALAGRFDALIEGAPEPTALASTLRLILARFFPSPGRGRGVGYSIGCAPARRISFLPAMLSNAEFVRSHIRTVPDWPKPGVMFRDITPVLQDPRSFRVLVDIFVHRYMNQ